MKIRSILVLPLLLAGILAHAEVVVGISLSTTGAASSLGIPQQKSMGLRPNKIGDEPIRVVIFDDATDPTQANKNVRKLVTEEKADIIIGSSSAPASLSIAQVAAELSVVQIAMAPIEVPLGPNNWTYSIAQPMSLMAEALVQHMKTRKIKTLGFIGFSDSYGENWLRDTQKAIKDTDIKLVAVERYHRPDVSVNGQVVKLIAAKPDAILIAGAGTPVALPQIGLVERGYKGQIYQTHGAASRDVIRLAGKSMEGTILTAGPVLVPELLPENHPSKKIGLEYVTWYEKAYGKDSRTQFGSHPFDALQILKRIVPRALKVAKPGTVEFRKALRDALESEREIVATHGVFNMTSSDRFGVDTRARVLLKVEKGEWKLLN
jgi:branched-chain amino acid transport system substrate-binding protein